MTRDRDVEVFWYRGKWRVIFHTSHLTQAKAITHATEVADELGSEKFVRTRRGWWRARDTYGDDPPESKG